MAPTEGRVTKPEWRWDCRRSTPQILYLLTLLYYQQLITDLALIISAHISHMSPRLLAAVSRLLLINVIKHRRMSASFRAIVASVRRLKPQFNTPLQIGSSLNASDSQYTSIPIKGQTLLKGLQAILRTTKLQRLRQDMRQSLFNPRCRERLATLSLHTNPTVFHVFLNRCLASVA